MIDLQGIPPVLYQDPWDLSFPQRFQCLLRGVIKVAYFYERADNSTFRYRAYNPAQVLNELSVDVSASFFFLEDLSHFEDIAACADILVLCRVRYCENVNSLISRFKRKGKTVIFDVDDLVFDLNYAHFIANNNAMRLVSSDSWDDWFGYVGRIGLTLTMCDHVIVTNAYLAKKIVEYKNIPVKVLPNFFNKEQAKLSDAIFKRKQSIPFNDGEKISIGYFSGSPTHARDFEVASQALNSLLARRPNVHLQLAGYMGQHELQSIYPKQVSKIPFHDYVNLQRAIGAVNINIAPLQNNYFTNCKSELKYFEAAIVGTMTIATPIHTFAQAIVDGENGYLSDGLEWEEKIEHAIDSFEDWPRMAMSARQHAWEKFSWLNQLTPIKESLGLISPSAETSRMD